MSDTDTLPTPTPYRKDWASCKGMDIDIWYPDNEDDDEANFLAKEICLGCPIREGCLNKAMAEGTKDGIWGGLTYRERYNFRRRRRKVAKEMAACA